VKHVSTATTEYLKVSTLFENAIISSNGKPTQMSLHHIV